MRIPLDAAQVLAEVCDPPENETVRRVVVALVDHVQDLILGQSLDSGLRLGAVVVGGPQLQETRLEARVLGDLVHDGAVVAGVQVDARVNPERENKPV